MTLPTIVKKWILGRYAKAETKIEPKDVHAVSMCEMQYCKGSLPENITTVGQLIDYLVQKLICHLQRQNSCSIVIGCWDIETFPVKSIIEYGKRKEWRCKKCKLLPEWPYSEECEKKTKCRDMTPLKFDEGPHLQMDRNAPLPVPAKHWMRYAGDSRNLRYELYPRLMNALLTRPEFMPGLNQTIIISGLPCDSEPVAEGDPRWKFGYFTEGSSIKRLLKPWPLDDLRERIKSRHQSDPDTFKKVYRIQNVNGVILRHEVPEMKHSIHEADSAIFYFSKFYPNANFTYLINDGDAISIGLLRVIEDFQAGDCALKRYIALPRRRPLKPGEHNWNHQYLDLVALKKLIETDPVYTAAGVSNPVATVVFLIILAGTDFFKNYCPYITYKTKFNDDPKKAAKQRDGIWDTFHKRLPMFRNLVQWNICDMIPDPTAKRRIVVDEELFQVFTYYCYMHKYMPKGTEKSTFEDVRIRCSKLSKPRQMPDRAQINLWCREVVCNLDYWTNSCRNIVIDPFMKIDGKPYYGYVKCAETGKYSICDPTNLSEKQEPVDERYKRNFYKRVRKKGALKKRKGIPENKQQKAIAAIRGKI